VANNRVIFLDIRIPVFLCVFFFFALVSSRVCWDEKKDIKGNLILPCFFPHLLLSDAMNSALIPIIFLTFRREKVILSGKGYIFFLQPAHPESGVHCAELKKSHHCIDTSQKPSAIIVCERSSETNLDPTDFDHNI